MLKVMIYFFKFYKIDENMDFWNIFNILMYIYTKSSYGHIFIAKLEM